jgi:glycosyltransferase involved in cell wall biosynthesis
MSSVGKDPLFSVIIPTYGRPELLGEAIDSVLAQSVQDFECIVVDDASPEPPMIVSDPRVRLIRRSENHGGPAAGRNTGIQAARGRFVAFLDDDDLYAPERLALALDAIERAPVTICWTTFHGDGGGSGRTLNGNVEDTILDGLVPHVGATTVRRDVVLLFDEGFMGVEDVDWWIRMSRRSSVATVPRPGYVFRRHSGERIRNGAPTRIRENVAILRTYADYFADHPRAAAFRWKRVGLLAQQFGDYSLARRAFRRSFRLRHEIKTLAHLGRSFRATEKVLEAPL